MTRTDGVWGDIDIVRTQNVSPKPALAKNGEIGRGNKRPDNVRFFNEYGNRGDNVTSTQGGKRVGNTKSFTQGGRT